MAAIPTETVLSTHHYTDDLFSFKTTRPSSFRFRSGEFAMLGLMADGKPLLRAYSIASPNWADELEFYSIKVPNGPLTSRLQHIKPGDEILLKPKATGTLVHDALVPGKNLWLVSSGTGIAPFTSVARDPETYERFEQVILVQTCRQMAELQYGIDIVDEIRSDEMLSELVGDRLKHVATVTRESPGPNTLEGRCTDLIRSGDLFEVTGTSPWSPEDDRVMICGSTAMLTDTRELCEAAGLDEGSNSQPGRFVVEKAFVG
ncbi:ferredoxin--NADP reductase [Acuticoccus sp. I52.16.1]|uniref:ferredoxin--NADP reductase n=1 Tax=Acuticoccus sp. I52.16.1 TaxID=2928472 RepID=UPI001FCFFE42|nr:ferredoxin--NADP reductase [Acuticoccus sp. I52.16.1]UOM34697.1 ferredoxin--NADP reductase [Acuticoccus sp. I52.16.1]